MFAVVIPRWVKSWFKSDSSNHALDEDESDNYIEDDEECKSIRKIFNAATGYLPRVMGRISNNNLLEFYAFYKQATCGDSDPSKRPSLLDVKNRSKFDVWATKRGMSRYESMQAYIQRLEDLNVGFDPEDATQSTQGFGNRPSQMMLYEDASVANTMETDKKVEEWFAAVKADKPEKLKAFLDERPDLLNTRDCHMKLTALHWAVDGGLESTAIYLLKAGADVNSIDGDGNTPLHFAALCGRRDLAELLITSGADLQAKNSEGERPVDCCDRDLLNVFLALGS